jgi:hypothetical protein
VNELWEVLVPAVRNDGRPFRLRHHRVWDAQVRAIAGGLTVLRPVLGEWASPTGGLFRERMIPVRVACTAAPMDRIAELVARHYDQHAVMFYRVSDLVVIRQFTC